MTTILRALALLIAFPALTWAQTIRGQVVDSITQAPLPGVVVVLLGRGDVVMARGLTNDGGAFLLTAPAAGAYRLRAMRIGFRPVTLPEERLQAEVSVARRLALMWTPVRLDTVRVAGRNQCRATAANVEVATIWEQARTVLIATQVTAEDRPFGGTVVVYDRALKPQNQQVLQQQARIVSGFAERLWGSASAADLRRDGYVVAGENQLIFHAPDLDVLLSPEFGEDHCFRLAETSDASRLGIAFEPNQRRRNIPEIEGTMWIDRANARLQEISFTYTNVPLPEVAGKSGGRMQFVPLRNDAWVVSRWDIRMPLVESRSTMGMGGINRVMAGMNNISEVRAILVRGGELSRVTHGTDTLWTRAPIVVEGVVVDSATGKPVGGATVRVTGLAAEEKTEADGWFTISDILPGTYEMRVSTPSLDSLGASHRTDLAVTGDSAQVVVRVPTRASMLQMLCPQGVSGLDGIITGVVRVGGDSTRAPNVPVRAEWEVLTPRPDGVDRLRRSTSARTNAHGIYRICGVPQETNLAVVAEVDSASGRDTLRLPAARRVAELDLGLVVPTPGVQADTADAEVRDRRVVRLIRGIVRDTSGSLIDHARINYTPTRGTTSDAEGEFSIGLRSRGDLILDIRRIGYEPQRIPIPEGGDTLITIRLKTLARSLAAVRVEARSVSNSLKARGFYDRLTDSDKGIARGQFFTAEDIEKRNPARIEQMFYDIQGIRVLPVGNKYKLLGTMRRLKVEGGQISLEPCTVTVYVDGIRMNTASGESTGDLSDLVDPRQISGMEVYARGVNAPPRYPSQNAGCAVVVVWTKM